MNQSTISPRRLAGNTGLFTQILTFTTVLSIFWGI
jgi:hypothetical protein